MNFIFLFTNKYDIISLLKNTQVYFGDELEEKIMSLFDHEARQFKFDVLREVSKRTFSGTLNEDTCDVLANILIPTQKADFRCCVQRKRNYSSKNTYGYGESASTCRKR